MNLPQHKEFVFQARYRGRVPLPAGSHPNVPAFTLKNFFPGYPPPRCWERPRSFSAPFYPANSVTNFTPTPSHRYQLFVLEQPALAIQSLEGGIQSFQTLSKANGIFSSRGPVGTD